MNPENHPLYADLCRGLDALALDRQHARGRSEDKTSQLLYNQLGVVVWWLERYKGPMPPNMPQKVQEALDILRLVAVAPPRAEA